MLSTRLLSSLNANASSSIQFGGTIRDTNTKNGKSQRSRRSPKSQRQEKCKESIITRSSTPSSVTASVSSFALSPVASPVSSPITVGSTADGELEQRLQHLDTVSKIRSRRDSARLKYQQILINRSKSKTSSDESVHTSNSELSRPFRIQRDCSEIDERDESRRDFFLDSKTSYSLSYSLREVDDNSSFGEIDIACTTPTLPLRAINASPINNYIRNYGDSYLETGLNTYRNKPKPHIKSYAKEYHKLLDKVVDLLSKREDVSQRNLDAPLRTGQLSKVATMVMGIGFKTYVELKLGIFRYYEDVGNGNVKIRTIPLQNNSTKCRATKHLESQPFRGWSRVFELITEGSGKRLFWMAKSEKERDDWVEAINSAMVLDTDNPNKGASETDSPTYNADIVLYLHTQGLVRGVLSKEDYLGAVSLMVDKRLSIPVDWLMQYSGITTTISELDERDLCRQLLNGSIAINGQKIKSLNYEDAISTLTFQIVDIDNCTTTQNPLRSRIKESQAVHYARDILLTCCRETRDDDNHSLFCVNTIFSSKLADVRPSPSDAEPMKINLRRISADIGGAGTSSVSEKSHGNRDIICIASSDSIFSGQSEKTSDQLSLVSSCAGESVEDSLAMEEMNMNVEVTVKISNIYRICSKGHQSSNDEETLGLVRTHLIKTFKLSGGTRTQLIQDSSIVEFKVKLC